MPLDEWSFSVPITILPRQLEGFLGTHKRLRKGDTTPRVPSAATRPRRITTSDGHRRGIPPILRSPEHLRRKRRWKDGHRCQSQGRRTRSSSGVRRCSWSAMDGRSRMSRPRLGVTAQSLRNWVRQDEADRGERSDQLTSAEREELRRLRRENVRLKQERDILKRATALFARETETR